MNSCAYGVLDAMGALDLIEVEAVGALDVVELEAVGALDLVEVETVRAQDLMEVEDGSKGIRRIGNWLNAFSCEVQALIRHIFLVGYGVLVRHNAVQNDRNEVEQNAVQNPGIQIVENMNGLSVVSEIANQYGNRNVVTAPAKGNGNCINDGSTEYVNGMKSRKKNQSANVSKSENQKKHKANIKKSKKSGSKESLASPSKPRSFL
nr:hypothetical protein [Tanacetum cinerariifolium]